MGPVIPLPLTSKARKVPLTHRRFHPGALHFPESRGLRFSTLDGESDVFNLFDDYHMPPEFHFFSAKIFLSDGTRDP